MGCCLWGRTESDATEATYQQQQPTYSKKNNKLKELLEATIVCYIMTFLFPKLSDDIGFSCAHPQ